jgi:hypothetical protein
LELGKCVLATQVSWPLAGAGTRHFFSEAALVAHFATTNWKVSALPLKPNYSRPKNCLADEVVDAVLKNSFLIYSQACFQK